VPDGAGSRWRSQARSGRRCCSRPSSPGRAGRPTLDEAAAFGGQPATGPAPAAQGKLLAAEQDGVAFPEWDTKFGWEATGIRTGEVEGRDATTVYHEKEGKTLAYTIVGGDALDVPDDARSVTAEGVSCTGSSAAMREPVRAHAAR